MKIVARLDDVDRYQHSVIPYPGGAALRCDEGTTERHRGINPLLPRDIKRTVFECANIGSDRSCLRRFSNPGAKPQIAQMTADKRREKTNEIRGLISAPSAISAVKCLDGAFGCGRGGMMNPEQKVLFSCVHFYPCCVRGWRYFRLWSLVFGLAAHPE